MTELTKSDPNEFALLSLKAGEVQKIAEDGCVDDLDTNIAVEQRGNQARDERDCVTQGLPYKSEISIDASVERDNEEAVQE